MGARRSIDLSWKIKGFWANRWKRNSNPRCIVSSYARIQPLTAQIRLWRRVLW